MCMTPCMVRLAISAAHSSPIRYSEVNGSALNSGPDFDALPFTSLFLLDDEFAAEVANRTMHGVMHIGLVPDGTGGFRAQMAVLVKPNGLLGTAYMAAIRPFRHLIVYPPMLRQIGRVWQSRLGTRT